MSDHDPAGAAKEAAAVKLVELAALGATIILAVLMQVAQRQASSPDFIPTARARAARAYERRWARWAGRCWRRAEAWRLAYERTTGGHG